METVIYVYLLDEGTDCWRPVHAVKHGAGVYQIVQDNEADSDEIWQFSKGDIVRCEMRKLSGGDVPIAVEKLQNGL